LNVDNYREKNQMIKRQNSRSEHIHSKNVCSNRRINPNQL